MRGNDDAFMVSEAIREGLTHGNSVSREASPEAWETMSDPALYELREGIARGMGLMVLRAEDVVGEVTYELWPADASSPFAVSREWLRTEFEKAAKTGDREEARLARACQAVCFIWLVNELCSSELPPSYVAVETLPVGQALAGISEYFDSVISAHEGEAEPPDIYGVAMYFKSRPEVSDNETDASKDRRRTRTRSGLLNNLLRVLKIQGLLDASCLENGQIRPTPRFSCAFERFYASQSAERALIGLDDGSLEDGDA